MNPAILLVLILLVGQTVASPSVSVSLDRTFYSPGDSVAIVVTVLAPTRINATLLWLYVDRPDGSNLYYTDLPVTNTTVVIDLPVDAPNGTYTVSLDYGHQMVETCFVVQDYPIPEAPSFVMPWLLILLILICLPLLGSPHVPPPDPRLSGGLHHV